MSWHEGIHSPFQMTAIRAAYESASSEARVAPLLVRQNAGHFGFAYSRTCCTVLGAKPARYPNQ